MSDWLIGDTARLTLNVTDADGLPADATALTLRIMSPSGAVITVAEPTRTALGAYHHDLPLDRKGNWYYRWDSGDALPAAGEGVLTVQPSRFPPLP